MNSKWAFIILVTKFNELSVVWAIVCYQNKDHTLVKSIEDICLDYLFFWRYNITVERVYKSYLISCHVFNKLEISLFNIDNVFVPCIDIYFCVVLFIGKKLYMYMYRWIACTIKLKLLCLMIYVKRIIDMKACSFIFHKNAIMMTIKLLNIL